MHNGLSWGILIVLYLFLAGLSAGAFATSALAYLLKPATYARVIRFGAYLAPFPVAIGTGLLVLDLGRPLAFYKLLLTVQPASPMSWGVWLLSLFLLISLIYAYLQLPAHLQPWQFARRKDALKVLTIAGLPVAAGVGVYTGILLAAGSRPLWSNPLLPQLFLVSALSTGAAAVLVTAAARRRDEAQPSEFRLLLLLDLGLISLEILILASMILFGRLGNLGGRLAMDEIVTGPFGPLFWAGVVVVGLLAPLVIEVRELLTAGRGGSHGRSGHRGHWLELATGTLVLVGGLILRYVVVYAGQATRWVN